MNVCRDVVKGKKKKNWPMGVRKLLPMLAQSAATG